MVLDGGSVTWFIGQPCTFIGQFWSRDPFDVISGHFSHTLVLKMINYSHITIS